MCARLRVCPVEKQRVVGDCKRVSKTYLAAYFWILVNEIRPKDNNVE